MSETKRLVVGISGSSGAILGIRLLQALRDTGIETHLVISPAGRMTIEQETGWSVERVLALADVHYSPREIGAAIASGSFATIGMVVIPCSIKSLSAIANSYTDDLLSRAADVTLKEGRPLLLVVREAPLHAGHIDLLRKAAASGAVIFPPVPAFYTHPASLDDMVDNIVGRVLARLGIENSLYGRWQGPVPTGSTWPPADLLALPAMTLSTSGADGEPHAAPLYFAADPQGGRLPTLYFFSSPQSQHAQDASQNPRAAAAIYPIVSDYREIRGLQLRGTLSVVPAGEAWQRAWLLYRQKFPFVVGLEREVAGSTLFAFTPSWIRLVDNRRGLGYKEEHSA